MRRGFTAMAFGSLLALRAVTACGGDDDGDQSGDGGESGRAGNGGAPSAGNAGNAGEGGETDPTGGTGPGGAGAGGEGGGTSVPTRFECGTRDPAGATTVDALIDSDQDWNGTLYLTGPTEIANGATITIAPGTQIVMAADSALTLGDGVTLLAEGTAAAPIRFCGEVDEAGSWDGVELGPNVSGETALRNVLVADAGGTDPAVAFRAGVIVENLQVRNSGADGVLAADFAAGSQGLSVDGASGVAAVLTSAAAATRFPAGGTLSGNGEDSVRLRFAVIDADCSFGDLGVPYVQEAPIGVRGGAEVTFEAGVEYRFADGAELDVGAGSSVASIIVSGSATRPVIFRGETAAAGSWGGLYIRPNVRASSRLSQLEIRHGGAAAANPLFVQAAITIDGVLLDENATGALIRAPGLAAGSRNLTITGTQGAPLTLEPQALASVPAGGSFTGNDLDEIGVEGGDYSATGTVPNLGVPYAVLGNVNVRDGGSMTLVAGTEFVMSDGASIEFGESDTAAAIVAVGSEAAPIRFTGAGEAAGSWRGLIVLPTALASSRFEHVDVRHATDACLTLHRPVSVTNSSFSDCAGYGILKRADDTTNYLLTNEFSMLGVGPVGDLPP